MNNNRTRAIHNVPHVWEMKRCKNLNRNCPVCQLTLGFLSNYEKCSSCKICVHVLCKEKVNNNCGLTPRHLKEWLTQLIIFNRQDNWNTPEITNSRSMNNIFEHDNDEGPLHDDTLLAPKNERFDRKSWNIFSIRGNAKSWRDETIPFEEIKIGNIIGRGRFGEVFEGFHLDITNVAIKFLDMNYVDESKRIEAFKRDTACIQSARHENLTYFFGYIMDRAKPGIVMELIKGRPLNFLLHDDDFDPKLDFNDTIDYAKQISQGMSYLHKKGFLHKDLRSNNIFIKEKEKSVKITDFGIFNIKRLSCSKRRYSFSIPENWLCYLAPELIRSFNDGCDIFPFSEWTDVYSFGTIWYELIMNCFPFSSIHPDCVIWQVGNGLKAPLADANICHEAKILLMYCWAFIPSERRPFSQLVNYLDSMPKRILRKSPVYKSFESIF